jgi:hypothetical protein
MAWKPKPAQGPHPFATRVVTTKLARLEKRALGPRHKRTDFYEYLEGVLKLYLMWKERKYAGKKARRVLAEMYPDKVKIRRGTHTIRCIIDASSPAIDALSKGDKEAEEKKRSRWKNALRYAVRKRATVKEIGLGGFFGRNGGPAGCAGQMAAILKAKKSHGISFPSPKGTMTSSGP